MFAQYCQPYRGLGVYLRITRAETNSVDGLERRYLVAWYIHKVSRIAHTDCIASFAESHEFLSAVAALQYGERRAYTFIDCALNAQMI